MELQGNLETLNEALLDIGLSKVTGLRRQVVCGLFGFNLLSKEDASL